MSFCNSVTFLPDSCWIGRKKLKSKILIVYLSILFIFFLFRNISLFVLIKVLTNRKSSIQIVRELSTINHQSKGNVRLLSESFFNNRSDYFISFVLTILKKNDRCISIFIKNEIELKLWICLMKSVKVDERWSTVNIW